MNADDIKLADAVIIASDVAVSEMERFEDKKIIRVDLNESVKNPEALLKKAMST